MHHFSMSNVSSSSHVSMIIPYIIIFEMFTVAISVSAATRVSQINFLFLNVTIVFATSSFVAVSYIVLPVPVVRVYSQRVLVPVWWSQIRPVPDSAKRIPRMRAQAQSRYYLAWRSVVDIPGPIFPKTHAFLFKNWE